MGQFQVLLSTIVTIEWIYAMDYLTNIHTPGHDNNIDIQGLWNTSQARVKNFEFQNCNHTPVPVYFHYLDALPDPINMTQHVFILSYAFHIDRELGGGDGILEADLSIRLKTPIGFTELCHILGPSICHTRNLCKRISRLFPIRGPCLLGTPNCSCPLPPKLYIKTKVPILFAPLPFLFRGEIHLTAKLKDKGQLVACVQLKMCFTECPDW